MTDYQKGFICLVHLLIGADGMRDQSELDGIELIRQREEIPLADFQLLLDQISSLTEEEVYDLGMDLVKGSTFDQKVRLFTYLFLLSEIDGRVHRKEIRLLIYSLHDAGISFETIVDLAKQAGPLNKS